MVSISDPVRLDCALSGHLAEGMQPIFAQFVPVGDPPVDCLLIGNQLFPFNNVNAFVHPSAAQGIGLLAVLTSPLHLY